MAKVFLDTNYFIDAVIRKPEKQILESLENHTPFISALTIPIYCYLQKIKIPNPKLTEQIGLFKVLDFSEKILSSALDGPSQDLEDNVQLHSATDAQCGFFLTNDKQILNMKFFGKTRILADFYQPY